MRKVNRAGLDLIKSFEGLELKAYQDSVGVWTIGYGHTEGVKRGDVITREEANRIFEEDINHFAAGVEKLIHRDVTDNQFAAMVSLAFNVGIGNFAKSTLLKLVNAGSMNNAAEQFLHWNRAGGQVLNGLTRRRKAERALFLDKPLERVAATTEDNIQQQPASSSPLPVEVPPLPEEMQQQTSSMSMKDGDMEMKTSGPAPQPETVYIEKPQPLGFASSMKKKISTVVGGNVTLQVVRDYAEQAKAIGLSPRFWMWISVFAVVGGLVWLAVEVYRHWSANRRELEITKELVAANSTPTNTVALIDSADIPKLAAKDVKIVRR